MNKLLKWSYWISTAILVITMLLSGYSYIASPEMKEAFLKLGFPDYFRIELAVAKILGALVLILPTKNWVKALAYAGFSLAFISAIIAHSANGDQVGAIISPIVFLGILAVSFFSSYTFKNYSLT